MSTVQASGVHWDLSPLFASPKAAQQYPVLVQNMLAALYADADFVAAIR